jgi:hypothetical protein
VKLKDLINSQGAVSSVSSMLKCKFRINAATLLPSSSSSVSTFRLHAALSLDDDSLHFLRLFSKTFP